MSQQQIPTSMFFETPYCADLLLACCLYFGMLLKMMLIHLQPDQLHSHRVNLKMGHCMDAWWKRKKK